MYPLLTAKNERDERSVHYRLPPTVVQARCNIAPVTQGHGLSLTM